MSVGMIGIVMRLPISVATAKIPVAIVRPTQSRIAKIGSSPDDSVALPAMIAGTGMRKRMAFSLGYDGWRAWLPPRQISVVAQDAFAQSFQIAGSIVARNQASCVFLRLSAGA